MTMAAFAKQAGSCQRPKAQSTRGHLCTAQLNTMGALPMAKPRPRSAWDSSTSTWRIRSADSVEPMGPEHRRKDLASLRHEIVQDARLRLNKQQDVMGHEPGAIDAAMDSLLDALPRSPLIDNICVDSDWLRQQELMSASLAEAQSRVLEARQNTDKAIKCATEARRRSRGLVQRIAAIRSSRSRSRATTPAAYNFRSEDQADQL